ncbi:MAG TPA: Uma2 family endonuclease [Rhodopila sp.]|nr:Uma2 family endonuclease [Rhodopila sp.]
MNVVRRETNLTIEQFLAWEDQQEGRHEFDGRAIIAMTGGSRNHQRIVINLMRILDQHLDSALYEAVPELRIKVGGKIRYPDVTVCAGTIAGSTRTLHDAVFIFEVLSKDTANVDRRQKRAEYTTLPSLRQYILVDQDRPAVTIIERVDGAWTETQAAQDVVVLQDAGVVLSFPEIYANVRFA